MHFLERKLPNFKQNFTKTCSLGSKWQYDSIGSDYGLVPKRHQAIIWNNVCMFYWSIHASLGLNELKPPLIIWWYNQYSSGVMCNCWSIFSSGVCFSVEGKISSLVAVTQNRMLCTAELPLDIVCQTADTDLFDTSGELETLIKINTHSSFC